MLSPYNLCTQGIMSCDLKTTVVTWRSKQEFVQTMRTELGTQGGFSMPEFYWRISREEMSRGKFYSRIDRLDWEDM